MAAVANLTAITFGPFKVCKTALVAPESVQTFEKLPHATKMFCFVANTKNSPNPSEMFHKLKLSLYLAIARLVALKSCQSPCTVYFHNGTLNKITYIPTPNSSPVLMTKPVVFFNTPQMMKLK